MENIEGYEITRDGDNISIIFYDIVEEGTVYTLPREDAARVATAILRAVSGID